MSSELSASEWVALARSATDAGMLFLLVTGGEPFLRRDFFDIWEPLTELGLYLSLFTNGTLIDSEVARRLAQRPPFRMEITLYGASADTYGRVTGHPEAFEQCCAAIEALRSAGLDNLLLKSTLNRYNVRDLSAMREMAKDWGLSFTPSWLLSHRRDRGPSAVDDFRLEPDEVTRLEIEDGILPWSSEGLAHDRTDINPQEGFPCNAGRCVFVVDSEGAMTPCMDMPEVRVYPRESGFAAAWTQLKDIVRNIPVSAACSSRHCELFHDCTWCPAMSFPETGAYGEPVPYICEVARVRKHLREKHK